MFQRKMKALGYTDWDQINTDNISDLRKVIVWLEDQKIRYYTINDRKPLRDITSDKWPETFEKYCNDVKCPITKNIVNQLEWFIGYAIWLEFMDTHQKCEQVLKSKAKTKTEIKVADVKPRNSTDNLDFDSNVFKTDVSALAKLLKVQQHPDHHTILQACAKLVCSKLNTDTLAQSRNLRPTKAKTLKSIITLRNFNTKDTMLDDVAKALSLLYIQDLRNLQTKINETIVAVQNVTADPKTDTKLGKVGK